MRFDNNFILELIESSEPLIIIGKKLLDIWLSIANKESDLGTYYYEGEEASRDFEELVLKSFWEFYDILSKACLEEKSVFELYPESSIVIMDGMSIREGAILYKVLKNKGYTVRLSYNFSSLPSDTEFFREKINKTSDQFHQINNPQNIRLTGSEDQIWSFFPDIMLDKIKSGHAVISSLEEMYNIVERITLQVISQLNSEIIIITSDHGYIRTEAGFVFPVSEKAKRKFQQIFGSKRYVEMDNLDAEDLIMEGYVKEFNGYYITKSRYLWPVSGRYSIYIHGGLSLMECFVPVLEVER